MNVDWKNALSSKRENKVLVNESKIIKGYNVKGKCWTLSEIAWLLQVVISKIPDCKLRLGLCCYFNMFHLKNRLLWYSLLPKQKQGTFGTLRASHKPPCRRIWLVEIKRFSWTLRWKHAACFLLLSPPASADTFSEDARGPKRIHLSEIYLWKCKQGCQTM